MAARRAAAAKLARRIADVLTDAGYPAECGTASGWSVEPREFPDPREDEVLVRRHGGTIWAKDKATAAYCAALQDVGIPAVNDQLGHVRVLVTPNPDPARLRHGPKGWT